MQFKALPAKNIYWITPLIIILAYNLLHWRHTSKFLDSSLLYRFQFKLSIIRKWQVNQQLATVNFFSCKFWLIDSISWSKSCLKCISQQKFRVGCWVAPSRPPRPPTRTSLRYAQQRWNFQVSWMTRQNGITLSQQDVQSRNEDNCSHKVFALHYDRKFGINDWLRNHRTWCGMVSQKLKY